MILIYDGCVIPLSAVTWNTKRCVPIRLEAAAGVHTNYIFWEKHELHDIKYIRYREHKTKETDLYTYYIRSYFYKKKPLYIVTFSLKHENPFNSKLIEELRLSTEQVKK